MHSFTSSRVQRGGKRKERRRERQTDIRRQTDGQTHRCQKHKDIKKHDITSEREYALGD